MASLFKIGEELARLDLAIDSVGPEIDDDTGKALDAWQADLMNQTEEKAGHVSAYLDQLAMEAKAAREKAKEWAAKAARREATHESIRKRFLAFMVAAKLKEIVTPDGEKVRVQAGGKEPQYAFAIDLATVPDEFIRVKKELDKTAVKAALKEGKLLNFASWPKEPPVHLVIA